MRKVVLSCLVAYILGILAFETLSAAALMFTLLFVVTVVFIRYTFFWKNVKRFPLLIAFFFLFGTCYTSFTNFIHTGSASLHLGDSVTVKGRIVEVSDTDNNYYDRYVMETESIIVGEEGRKSELDFHEKIDLSLEKYKLASRPVPYRYGDVVTAEAVLEEPSIPLNSTDADYRPSKKADGIFFCVTGEYDASSVEAHVRSNFNIFDLAQSAREYFIGVIDTYFSGDEAGLLRGILLSDKMGFSEEFRERLSDTGMTYYSCVRPACQLCTGGIVVDFVFLPDSQALCVSGRDCSALCVCISARVDTLHHKSGHHDEHIFSRRIA